MIFIDYRKNLIKEIYTYLHNDELIDLFKKEMKKSIRNGFENNAEEFQREINFLDSGPNEVCSFRLTLWSDGDSLDYGDPRLLLTEEQKKELNFAGLESDKE